VNSRSKESRALLYILHSGNLYGTERMALATLQGMDEYDKRVVVAPPPSGLGSVADAAREAGYDAVTFRSRWDLVKVLAPWFRRYRKVDVIATGVSQNFLCYALGKLAGVDLRQLQVAHGGPADQTAFGNKRHLDLIPVRLVAVSEFVRGRLVHHGVRADSISVIDNFISDLHLKGLQRRPAYDSRGGDARPIDGSRVKVAIVSRLDPVKRIDILVGAVKQYGLADFQFEIYGTGSELDSLRDQAAGLPNLRLHGFVPDVSLRLSSADFLLHLCPDEPFGLVILEAFASGLVAIVPDSGGAGDLVDDGRTGLRFRANDPADLRRVLDFAKTISAERLQGMADASAAVVQQRFSQKEGLRRYREALTLSKPRRSAPR